MVGLTLSPHGSTIHIEAQIILITNASRDAYFAADPRSHCIGPQEQTEERM